MNKGTWTVKLADGETVPVKATEPDIEEGGALTFRDVDGVIVAAFAGGATPVWLSVQRLS